MKPDRKAVGVALTAAVLLIAGAEAAAQRQKTYNGEFRQAQNHVNRRQYGSAVQKLTEMLKQYTEPVYVKALRLYRVDAYMAWKKHAEALDDVTKLLAEFPKDADLQTQALLRQGDALREMKKFDEAVAVYRKIPKAHADYADRAADALLRAGDIYCNELKKFPEGLAVYAEVEKAFASQLPRAAEGARRAAVVHETLTKDLVKASAFYESLAVKYAKVYDENHRASYFGKAADCLHLAKKLPEAQAVAARAEKALDNIKHKTGFALRQADLLMEMGKAPEARGECERVICTYPLQPDTCHAAQVRLVQTWQEQSKFAEALSAARVLYDAAASEQNIRAAAHLLAQALRSVDGNLGRANAFLAYQRFGPAGPDAKPNTPDDVKVNPLAAVAHPPADKARDGRFAKAVAAQPATYEGYRAKGFLYAYWGKPKEAAKFFHLALKACTDAQVPQAAQELVLVGMKACTASFHGLDRILEFISYGPKGKSGKDNIPDPFKAIH